MQLSSLLVPRAFANLMLFRNLARLLNERLSMELQQQRNAVACTTRFNDLCVDIRRHVRRTNKIIEMHARQCIALLECLVLVPWAASMLKAFGPTCVGRVDGKISFKFHFSMRAEPHCADVSQLCTGGNAYMGRRDACIARQHVFSYRLESF
jgi:hypothetical protein